LKQIEAGISAKRALLQTKESDLYPTFFLGGGINYAMAPNRTDQKNPFVRDDYNYFEAGLTLGMRWLLDFSAISARIRSARAELNMSLEQKKRAALGFPVEVRKTYNDVIENKAKIDISQDERKAARGLMVLSLTNFELGIGEAKDLFEALFIYTKSLSSYLEAVRSYNLSLAMMSLVVGKEITSIEY
jgi:outer membrane protein TolC